MACDCQDIDFLPNNELIKKLLERTTFLGVVISSEDDPHNTEHKNFSVSFNSQLDTKEVSQILLWAANALLETANSDLQPPNSGV
jgi:hypothetical protein